MKRLYLGLLTVIILFSVACSKPSVDDSSEAATTETTTITVESTEAMTSSETDENPENSSEVLQKSYENGNILYQLGLFNGVSTVTYDPNLEGDMNREEAMKMIVSALGWEPADESECPFDDVSAWARPFVGRAYLQGIALGTVPKENKFGAKDPVTMQQLLTFYLRALGYEPSYAYENAIRLGEMKELTKGLRLTEDYLKRYHLVMVTYNALGTNKLDSPKTLVEELITEGKVDQSLAESFGLVKEYLYAAQREQGAANLDEESFEAQILNEKKAVVLFYQSGSELSEETLTSFHIAAITLADEAKAGVIEKAEAGALLTDYNITSFPTIKLFKNGEAITLPPVQDTDTLVQWVKNN
ncbi:MAG: hypothetical protein JXQ26_00925 [Tissierellales bacterium]|nr:hypothetical protein [Tissierellales bacterium]MBN2826520.1 hypothetical protein [Tissierellales bacterium]